MKKKSIIIYSMLVLFNIVVYSPQAMRMEDNTYINNAKRDLLVLMLAYPEEIKDIEVSEDNYIYLVLNNDKKVLYDDKKEKCKDMKTANADLQDTLEDIYPLESISTVIDGMDPGRGRAYSFLNSIYGSNQNQIEKNLSSFSTSCGNVMFNKNAKAGESLKKALNEARELSKTDNKVNNYIFPISGGYNYRVIQDTGRLSPHAYGIAIDLSRNDADYWKWVDKTKGSKRIEGYPKELVKVFEENGFVWGGKWEHFDILHFEYRPEIILKSKYFAETSKINNDKWYEGAPINDETQNKINLIDEKL
ncbi:MULTISPECIES: M15 family metallopeptidase [unclassified Clostridium]|uniref:M15 family metallopeptidase n=1 Tax=unclassified Clostridium TaxID=2614128 RepID=UPI00189A63D4|nr:MULTISPECIES: M15 family metallopeptidase [unclassified Clostridium]MCR1950924.1 M15 family metallopeptidase [Clostridium sp. DSM 100503]